ncbi:MAG: hypothetical protein U1G08_09535 [Verrucomicrobiota bacterium]
MHGFRSFPHFRLTLWVGWGLFVGAFFLPAFRDPRGSTLPGYSCAWIAVTFWAPDRWVALIRDAQNPSALANFTVGWFNVSNLLCALAPAVQWFPAARRFRSLVALGCAFGVAQAIALVSGAIGGEPLWSQSLPGFWTWCVGYGVVALSVWGLGRVSPGS